MAIVVNTTASNVVLQINADGVDYQGNVDAAFDTGSGNVYTIPALQDVTVNATPGTFTWEQLDSLSQQIVTTPSTNSLDMNIVVDESTFFDATNGSAGILDTVNNKTKTYFRLYMNGQASDDRYIQGEGYLSGLAPTVSPTAPVWVSPLTVLIDGSFTHAQLP